MEHDVPARAGAARWRSVDATVPLLRPDQECPHGDGYYPVALRTPDDLVGGLVSETPPAPPPDPGEGAGEWGGSFHLVLPHGTFRGTRTPPPDGPGGDDVLRVPRVTWAAYPRAYPPFIRPRTRHPLWRHPDDGDAAGDPGWGLRQHVPPNLSGYITQEMAVDRFPFAFRAARARGITRVENFDESVMPGGRWFQLPNVPVPAAHHPEAAIVVSTTGTVFVPRRGMDPSFRPEDVPDENMVRDRVPMGGPLANRDRRLRAGAILEGPAWEVVRHAVWEPEVDEPLLTEVGPLTLHARLMRLMRATDLGLRIGEDLNISSARVDATHRVFLLGAWRGTIEPPPSSGTSIRDLPKALLRIRKAIEDLGLVDQLSPAHVLFTNVLEVYLVGELALREVWDGKHGRPPFEWTLGLSAAVRWMRDNLPLPETGGGSPPIPGEGDEFDVALEDAGDGGLDAPWAVTHRAVLLQYRRYLVERRHRHDLVIHLGALTEGLTRCFLRPFPDLQVATWTIRSLLRRLGGSNSSEDGPLPPWRRSERASQGPPPPPPPPYWPVGQFGMEAWKRRKAPPELPPTPPIGADAIYSPTETPRYDSMSDSGLSDPEDSDPNEAILEQAPSIAPFRPTPEEACLGGLFEVLIVIWAFIRDRGSFYPGLQEAESEDPGPFWPGEIQAPEAGVPPGREQTLAFWRAVRDLMDAAPILSPAEIRSAELQDPAFSYRLIEDLHHQVRRPNTDHFEGSEADGVALGGFIQRAWASLGNLIMVLSRNETNREYLFEPPNARRQLEVDFAAPHQLRAAQRAGLMPPTGLSWMCEGQPGWIPYLGNPAVGAIVGYGLFEGYEAQHTRGLGYEGAGYRRGGRHELGYAPEHHAAAHIRGQGWATADRQQEHTVPRRSNGTPVPAAQIRRGRIPAQGQRSEAPEAPHVAYYPPLIGRHGIPMPGEAPVAHHRDARTTTRGHSDVLEWWPMRGDIPVVIPGAHHRDARHHYTGAFQRALLAEGRRVAGEVGRSMIAGPGGVRRLADLALQVFLRGPPSNDGESNRDLEWGPGLRPRGQRVQTLDIIRDVISDPYPNPVALEGHFSRMLEWWAQNEADWTTMAPAGPGADPARVTRDALLDAVIRSGLLGAIDDASRLCYVRRQLLPAAYTALDRTLATVLRTISGTEEPARAWKQPVEGGNETGQEIVEALLEVLDRYFGPEAADPAVATAEPEPIPARDWVVMGRAAVIPEGEGIPDAARGCGEDAEAGAPGTTARSALFRKVVTKMAQRLHEPFDGARVLSSDDLRVARRGPILLEWLLDWMVQNGLEEMLREVHDRELDLWRNGQSLTPPCYTVTRSLTLPPSPAPVLGLEHPPGGRTGQAREEPMEVDPAETGWEAAWGADWHSSYGAPVRASASAIPDLSTNPAWAALSARRVRNEWEQARAGGMRQGSGAQSAWEAGDPEERVFRDRVEGIDRYDERSSARRARHRGARDDQYGAAESEDSDPDDGDPVRRHIWVRWRDPTEVVAGETREFRAGSWPRREGLDP